MYLLNPKFQDLTGQKHQKTGFLLTLFISHDKACIFSGEDPVPKERRKKKKGPKKPPSPSSPTIHHAEPDDDVDIDSVPIAPQVPGSGSASAKNLQALEMNSVSTRLPSSNN